MYVTPKIGLKAPEEEDYYGIDYVRYNNDILETILGEGLNEMNIKKAFYTVFTKIGGDSSEADETALSASEIDTALHTEWSGETSDDETALSADEIDTALHTEWSGESSADETALSAAEIETALST
ncbi:MAG: hypothetical protein J6C19_14485 [Lachnospiraceae bacterium]|nr:hypothetical protein [Lachnospiraceae bacterium]MBO5146710.1 hypothetical protein [Lachnospiraceae bacterium]